MAAPATADVVAAFVQSARARSCSEKYVGKIEYTLGFLVRACEVLPTSTEQLEVFLAGLRGHRTAAGAPLSDTTHEMVRGMLRALYAWIAERYPGVRNPMALIRTKRCKRKLPRVLTQTDVERVLVVNEGFPREYALICVMLDTFARLGEVAPLTWESVKFDGVDAEVHFGDAGKEGARSAPINRDTFQALRRASPAGGLWRKTDGEALTYYGVRRAFRRALARAGLKGNPHLMRHTAATLYVKNGGDQFSLMRIGGWTTLKAVQMYVHLANSDIRDQHARFSTVGVRAAQGGRQLHLVEEVS